MAYGRAVYTSLQEMAGSRSMICTGHQRGLITVSRTDMLA